MALLDTKTERLRASLTYDTGKDAAAAARQAVSEGNKLILGPLTADEVKAVAPIARAAKVPVVSYSNDASVAGNGIFPARLCAEPVDRPGGQLCAWPWRQELRGAGAQGRLWRTRRQRLPRRSQVGGRHGGRHGNVRPLGSLGQRGGQAARDPVQLRRAAHRRHWPDHECKSRRKCGAARRGANAKLLGTELWNTDNSISASSALRGAWFASVSDGLYRTLASKYRASYGTTPYRLASLGYDSVLLTVRISQDWKPGSDFPMTQLTDPDGFAGIDGAFRFGGSSASPSARSKSSKWIPATSRSSMPRRRVREMKLQGSKSLVAAADPAAARLFRRPAQIVVLRYKTRKSTA